MLYITAIEILLETVMSKRTLRSLEGVRPLYMLPNDPLGEEVLIPSFQMSTTVDCMVGFFSSDVLASLAPGLATYIASSENSFRLIISPLLRDEDKIAIEKGLNSTEVGTNRILEALTITENVLQHHTLKCLSWLIREGRVVIKVALMKNALFHPKVWLFENENDVMAVHGSSNVTYAGIQKNIEQIAVSKSWRDSDQSFITNKLRNEFSALWHNKRDSCIVVDMPEAVRQHLLKTYSSNTPPTENEWRNLHISNMDSDEEMSSVELPVQSVGFAIPSGLEFEKGPFQHQKEAVTAWCEAGYIGILEMATGSGKTITAMMCAYHLYKQRKPLLIIVAAPYLPLIEQWCDEITLFGLKPVNLKAAGNASKRAKELQSLRRRLQMDISTVEAVVVSHDILCTPEFHSALLLFQCDRLLIADEVHNLGQVSFINNPPNFFECRLGLSATPVRQYDEEGTEALLNYFKSISYQFKLEEAIGRCLVEYDYHVHTICLTENEMEVWFELTYKIKRNSWRNDGRKPNEYVAKLLWERRALLETAAGKIAKLDDLLNEMETSSLRHTLIYTSDKSPEQIKNVNLVLKKRNIRFHQLTAKETVTRKRTMRIIKSFQNGEIQVLTAKRVLDEGVNIPQVCTAFILASTTVERQWVQRRGRLLRTCNDINKTHSVIHDLLVLPPDMKNDIDSDARGVVSTELNRAQEFARLARNAGRSDGPLMTIDSMVDAAYL